MFTHACFWYQEWKSGPHTAAKLHCLGHQPFDGQTFLRWVARCSSGEPLGCLLHARFPPYVRHLLSQTSPQTVEASALSLQQQRNEQTEGMKVGEAACHIIYPGHGNIEGDPTARAPRGCTCIQGPSGSCPIIPTKHTPVTQGGCHSHFNVTPKG